jgi:hypothetical protein
MLVGVCGSSLLLNRKMPFIEGEVFGLLSRVGGHLRDVRLLCLLELKRRLLSMTSVYGMGPIKFFQAHGNVGPSRPSLREALEGQFFGLRQQPSGSVSRGVKEVDG